MKKSSEGKFILQNEQKTKPKSRKRTLDDAKEHRGCYQEFLCENLTSFIFLPIFSFSNFHSRDVNVFTVPMFVQRMIGKNCLISTAIDCTSIDYAAFIGIEDHHKQHSAYYFHNTEEWDEFDIHYVPLTSDNDSHVPSDQVIQKFIDTCNTQWKERPNTHIAVFDCCGGLGAAAFLVVCYMVDKLKAPLHVALAAIAEVSFPGIFDEILLRKLQARFKGKKELVVPKAPIWAIDIEDDDDEEETSITILPFDKQQAAAVTTEDSNTKRLKTAQDELASNKTRESLPTSPTIAGLEYCAPDSAKYQRATSVLQQLVGITSTGSDDAKSLIFPGCQHYTLTSIDFKGKGEGAQITKLHNVTWNPVGRRGLLLLLTDGVFFIEPNTSSTNISNNNGINVSLAHGMFFPSPKDLTKPQHRTLLDGILVFDKEGEKTTQLVPRYLASDILVHEGGMLLHKPFTHRIKYVLDGVYGVRKRHYASRKTREVEEGCFRFRVKDTFELRKTKYLLSNSFLTQVTHPLDGLQFIPLDEPYRLNAGEKTCSGNINSKQFVVWKKSDGIVPETLLIQCIKLILNDATNSATDDRPQHD